MNGKFRRKICLELRQTIHNNKIPTHNGTANNIVFAECHTIKYIAKQCR